MKNKYEVKIYTANPRNNFTVACESLNEAKTKMKNYESSEAVDCAKLYRDGECIAFREFDQKNITWMNPVSAAAATLGKKGGQATSPAKTAAVRENAKKGGYPKGRPRKPQP